MTAEKDVNDAGQALLDADHTIHQAAERTSDSTTVKVLGFASEISDQPQMRLVCGGLILVGMICKDLRMIGAGARMLVAHEIATATKNAIKSRVDRKRPRSASGKHEEKPQAGNSSDKEESSFPSGHSAGAMAVASALAAVYPEHRTPALLAAGAVALAQIPRCAHYPTDVGAGLAIGAASNGVVGLAGRFGRFAASRIAVSAPWWR